MRLTIKLFATFREGRKKIQVLDLPEGTTPENILDILKIDKSEVAIFLINGRDIQFNRTLSDNDVLSIFPPVGGG